jgi:adenylate kinase family enzyme
MIIGGPGSGKSTLAKKLGQLTGLPVFHLDAVYWRPGWTAPPEEEWLAAVQEIAARDAWIMEGGCSSTFPIRMRRAETAIWLDLPRRICFPRVLKRLLLHFCRVRPDVAPGCPERLDFAFLKWAWMFRPAHAAKYRLALARYASHANIMVFDSPRQIAAFLSEMSR